MKLDQISQNYAKATLCKGQDVYVYRSLVSPNKLWAANRIIPHLKAHIAFILKPKL